MLSLAPCLPVPSSLAQLDAAPPTRPASKRVRRSARLTPPRCWLPELNADLLGHILSFIQVGEKQHLIKRKWMVARCGGTGSM